MLDCNKRTRRGISVIDFLLHGIFELCANALINPNLQSCLKTWKERFQIQVYSAEQQTH